MSNKWLYPVYGVIRTATDAYFSCLNALKRRDVRKIYIYTDSRGFKVDRWYCKKNPIGSYIAKLARRYKIGYSICRYKHTTLIDFLYDIQHIDIENYDAIVLHVGVVDFSPRPISQAKAIIEKKAKKIVALFGQKALSEFMPSSYDFEYFGERTASIYSIQTLEKYFLPKLNDLRGKLIWIGVNSVLTNWDGNYDRQRPVNINIILEYQKCIDARYGGRKISLSNLLDKEVKKITVDNIHLSNYGMEVMAHHVISFLSGPENV